MTDPASNDQFQAARRGRGEQLRALIVSWAEDSTFISALNQQQRDTEEGKFELNDDWCVMADEVLGAYMSRPQMKWPDGEEPKEEPSRIIIP